VYGAWVFERCHRQARTLSQWSHDRCGCATELAVVWSTRCWVRRRPGRFPPTYGRLLDEALAWCV